MVELKNGETFNGHLVNCDNFMNITLREVYQTSAEGDKFWKLKECYIRGSTVRQLSLVSQQQRSCFQGECVPWALYTLIVAQNALRHSGQYRRSKYQSHQKHLLVYRSSTCAYQIRSWTRSKRSRTGQGKQGGAHAARMLVVRGPEDAVHHPEVCANLTCMPWMHV